MGQVKIIIRESSNTVNDILDFFDSLPSEYCSLGVDIEYYKRIDLLRKYRRSIYCIYEI